MGLVSDSLPLFCRRPLVGYSAVVIGTVTTMALGFGVWLHHMFATGIPFLALAFFSGASFAIAIPSAIAVFAWVATIWTGRSVLTAAFLYYASFMVMFVIGGVSGVVTAAVPADLQVTDTYFVVAHIHYVLIGINLFAVLGALHVWFPKMTGLSSTKHSGNGPSQLSSSASTWRSYRCIGPACLACRDGSTPTRRVWDGRRRNDDNCWRLCARLRHTPFPHQCLCQPPQWAACGSQSLGRAVPRMEHAVTAATLQFLVVPRIGSRHPLWESRLGDRIRRSELRVGLVLDRGKEALATTALDAVPDAILKMPDDSPAPFIVTLAMSVGFAGLLLQAWWLAGAGAIAVLAGLLVWLWPERELEQRAGTPT